MYRIVFAVAFSLGLAFATLGTSTPASAHGTCKIVGFEVNDYGKEGPKADALRLLEKRIPEWAKEKGIKNYHRRGKKKVSCRLFLDFGFFDEWTCTATQTVCY